MKRFFYSGLSRIILTALLLFSAIATGTYGFLTLRGPVLYGHVESVGETAAYSKLFAKYVERTSVYVRYLNEGFSIKESDLPPELTLLLEGNVLNREVEKELADVYHPSDTSLYYYHNLLNVQPTSFMYYVYDTATQKTYCSPGFNDYAINKSGSVEAFLSEGITQESIYVIMNNENRRIMTSGGNPQYLSRAGLMWAMDFLQDPLTQMAEFSDLDENHNPYSDESDSEEPPVNYSSDPFDGIPQSIVNPGSSSRSYLSYAFIADLPVADEFSRLESDFASTMQDYRNGRSTTRTYLLITIILFLLCNFLSGHRPYSEAITLRKYDRIPIEIILLALILMVAVPVGILFWQRTRINGFLSQFLINYRNYTDWIPFLFFAFSLYVIAFGVLYFSVIRRIKAGKLFHYSLVKSIVWAPLEHLYRRIQKALHGFSVSVPRIRRAAFLLIVCLLWFCCGLFILFACLPLGIILLGCEAVFCSTLFLHNILDQQHIMQSTKAMANGTLSEKITTDSMLLSNRQLSEEINHICDGLLDAVNRETKSEHMKTELITNVSHDIKTPLTSIINYIELIKKELPPEGKTAEYANILSQKSWRLKALIDDLVEASKAASGNIRLDPIRFNAVELVRQAIGDFDERLTECGLPLSVDLPEQPVPVLADGACTHRIIENMLSNVCKYALPGTRVFVSLSVVSDKNCALLTIKNISAQLLTKTPEELLTRFTRGNDDRSGEGSGLGLSIAQSLAALQGGSFFIEIDGDLFKAHLQIPLAPESN